MVRSRKIKRSSRRSRKKSLFLRLFPERFQAFLARRLYDTFAVTLGLAGLFIVVALLSYDHHDPSWNTAQAETNAIANWGRGPGAWIADLLLQTLGVGGFALGLGLIIWGTRSFRREELAPVWLRTIALMTAAVATSIAFAQIPSGNWTVHPYLGSSAGTLLLERLNAFSPLLGKVGVPGAAATLACASFLYAAAVTRQEIWMSIVKIKDAAAFCTALAVALGGAFMNWLRHYNDPDYRPQPFALFKHRRRNAAAIRRQPLVSTGMETDEDNEEEAQDEDDDTMALRTPEPRTKRPSTAIPVVTPQTGKAVRAPAAQQRFHMPEGEWELPALSLLQAPAAGEQEPETNEDGLRKNAELLQNVLADFNIQGDIVSIHPGPVVTLYELEPAPGTKTSRVISLSDDIARSMSAVSVRIAVVPGRNVIGIELPNKTRQIVYMHELMASRLFEKTNAKLPLALGKDISGQPILADLAKMPHLLVAGTTGSGKSVAVNTMILSLLFRLPPEKCRFIMIDPKMLELSVYDDIPHLLSPVVTEPGKAVVALKWTVREMEERYRSMSKLGVRNIEGYNARLREAVKNGETLMRKVQTGFDPESGKPIFEDQAMDLRELPYIVVVVDEFADLMLVAGKDVENAIQRLAQMARAAGIHLIMATQRPSVDVITGVIKANFPTRISFQVTSKIDSRTILGEGGAEQLLGMGDMLYMAPGGRITRVHGPFVSDGDVEKVVQFLKSQGEPAYIDDVTDGDDFGDSEIMAAMFGERESGGNEKVDELYDMAVAIVAREGKASTSFVQRHLQIGYNRAARIIEEMERQGIISPANAVGKREILVRDFSDV
jgi:S-DNA-T family DNA segregation ATPase FtsK/SpoIIIE